MGVASNGDGWIEFDFVIQVDCNAIVWYTSTSVTKLIDSHFMPVVPHASHPNNYKHALILHLMLARLQGENCNGCLYYDTILPNL